MQFVRKAEEALTGKKDESHESTKSSNHGPHSSNLANKLDPRVDSDRDNRAAHTDVTGAGPGTTHGSTAATGTHSSTLGSGTTHGPTTSTNAGPHSSNITNKADPRVDSDRDNRARHEGLAGAGTGTGLGSTHNTAATGTHGSTLGSGTTHGTSGVTGTGAGLGSTHGSTLGSGTGAPHSTPIVTPGSSSTNAGPHSSDIANKLDPRVDSGRDSHAQPRSPLASTGAGTTTHGTHTRDATAAPTGSAIGRSGLDSAGHRDALAGSSYNTPATGTATGATGTTGTTGTTGPHGSSIANKLDPRVDSDATRAQNEGLHRQI